MREGTDIFWICLPFSAGIALAIWLRGILPGPFCSMCLAGALLPLSIMLMIIAIKNDNSFIIWTLLFLFTGIFCGFSSDGPDISLQESRLLLLAQRCVSHFRSSIDALPFRSDESREILKALLTAERSGIERGTLECFRKCGASHLLALSGLHLGLIYSLLVISLSFLGNSPIVKLIRSGIIILACLFYCMMTGASASLVRAMLFILISELGKLMRWRKSSPIAKFTGALTLQLAGNPSAISTAGFQLSYMAMAGILLLLPKLQSFYPEAQKRIEKLNPGRIIWNTTALTISCQIFTFPVSYLHFGTLPGHFLLANLTALPLTSAIMVCTIICLFAAGIGLNPEKLVALDEKGIDLLLYIMKTISSM